MKTHNKLSDINLTKSSNVFDAEITVTSQEVKDWTADNNLLVELDGPEIYIHNSEGAQIATYYYKEQLLRFSTEVN